MADVQPFTAIRYAPDVDLPRVICPPFDTISPDEQRRLYRLSRHNAVRLELPRGRDPYKAAAKTLRQWLDKGTLLRDETPAFYLYQQEFQYGGRSYRRRVLLGRLRLKPWDSGVVLPHERTFNAPKEDRLKLLYALSLNTSPIFLMYSDSQQQAAPLLARAVSVKPALKFVDELGRAHTAWRIDDPHLNAALSRWFADEKLYVADGHHRYETALAFRDQLAAARDAPESFVLVALASIDDPGLLVLPIHRMINADRPVEETLGLLGSLFEVEARPSLGDLLRDMADRGRKVSCFGLIASDSPEFYLLTLYEPDAVASYLPAERSQSWRRLDTAVATHVILRHALGLNDVQMEDIRTVWYEDDPEAAVRQVRKKRARYALLLNPISPRRILSVADRGERMPQKSTFFYPKIPTGLLFNPLFPLA